ncbi:serine/arginine-rich splicing factor SR45 [Gracilaria domingensis]|nr:serine/arginine-rich splicing factor SR45 [Gracilaria domingensis]
MRVRKYQPLGAPCSVSQREYDDDDEDGTFFERVEHMSDWVRHMKDRFRTTAVDLERENGRLTVVLADTSTTKAIVAGGAALVKRFVDERVVGRRIDTLVVSVEPLCDARDAQNAARAAARVASAVDEIGVLAVSAAVFVALKDVWLPKGVRSVGIVDEFVTMAFVRAIPATLAALTKSATEGGTRRAVWAHCALVPNDEADAWTWGSRMLNDKADAARGRPLLERGEAAVRAAEVKELCASRGRALLRRAEAACRAAEVKGLCALGVRGAIERWQNSFERRYQGGLRPPRHLILGEFGGNIDR